MGELHLEVLQRRMEREFKVQAHFGRPRVSYRETILASARARGEFERRLGSQALHARVDLELHPDSEIDGVRVTHRLREGQVPSDCIQSMLDTVQGSAEGGGVFGFPVTGVRAEILDARLIEGSDPSAALNPAANRALYRALTEAKVAVLEPIMRLDVRTPEEYLGSVLKHLHAKRALISDTRISPTQTVILGSVPLAEMFGFSTTLRSLSQGRASFNLEPLDFRPVPANQEALFERRHLE